MQTQSHSSPHSTAPHSHASHSHGSHSHGVGEAGASERRIALAALLTGGFMVAEIAGGLISGSLALVADAGHMLTDCAGLALAWLGFRLARRPADWKRSYGYDRFGILVAFANGLLLFAIAGWIIFEAIERLRSPVEVLGGVMATIAALGLAVNVLCFWLLQGGDRNNLNIRAAVLHVAGDLLGSVAALIAALVILTTGWTPIDPILSVLVSVLILWSAWHIIRDSGHILLEGTPPDLDPKQIGEGIKAAIPAVLDVHHIHAWSLSQDRPVVTLHVRVGEIAAPERIVGEIKAHLKERFGVTHTTVELEFQQCADAGGTQAATRCTHQEGHNPHGHGH